MIILLILLGVSLLALWLAVINLVGCMRGIRPWAGNFIILWALVMVVMMWVMLASAVTR